MVDNVEITLSVSSFFFFLFIHRVERGRVGLLYILFVRGKELMSCLLLFLKPKDSLIY